MTTKNLLSTLIISSIFTASASAQKLPNKQETGVYAPVGVKIDGKLTEWGKTLQAYNQATEIYYTLANDADNLYFICKATEAAVIQKIMFSGITLTISAADKKATDLVAITYPIVPWVNTQVNYDLRPAAPLSDSAVLTINKKISGHMKEIKITGVKDIADGSVSVYNELGIKGSQNISSEKVYTYELALPLKYIRTAISERGTFNYTVQVNGMDMKTTTVVGGTNMNGGEPSDIVVPHGGSYNTSPTYFKASYQLAKKR